jgi:tetratricopeptide (TPR) repeat protein
MIMRRNSLARLGLVLAAVCLIPSESTLAQNSAPSAIQIFLPNGAQPSHAIRLTLVRDDTGYPETVFTDSTGKYRLPTPRTQSVNYVVTIEGDRQNYGNTTALFTLDRGIPNQTNIFLNPIKNEKGKPAGVVNAASNDENIPEKARTAYKQAMAAFKENKVDAAIKGLQQAISIYPQYVQAITDLGVVFMQLRRFDEAVETFKQAIAVDKRYFHARLNLGVVLTKQGKYREASEVLEPLFNENHGMLEVRLAYAKALRGAGELAEAEKVYRSTIDSGQHLTPQEQANLHFSLGVVLDRQGRFAQAVTELEKAIALDDGANTHLQLGATLIQLQQLGRAEQELLRAYDLAGNTGGRGAAQLLLGQIYYSQQRFAQAQRAYEQYLKDSPMAPDAAQINKLIAELKASSKN